MEFSASVIRSCSAYLRKNLWCACHNRTKSPKQIANGTNPRTETRNSPKFFGTCRGTTRSVSASPKITSLKISTREIAIPRRRKPVSMCRSESGMGIVASKSWSSPYCNVARTWFRSCPIFQVQNRGHKVAQRHPNVAANAFLERGVILCAAENVGHQLAKHRAALQELHHARSDGRAQKSSTIKPPNDSRRKCKFRSK